MLGPSRMPASLKEFVKAIMLGLASMPVRQAGHALCKVTS